MQQLICWNLVELLFQANHSVSYVVVICFCNFFQVNMRCDRINLVASLTFTIRAKFPGFFILALVLISTGPLQRDYSLTDWVPCADRLFTININVFRISFDLIDVLLCLCLLFSTVFKLGFKLFNYRHYLLKSSNRSVSHRLRWFPASRYIIIFLHFRKSFALAGNYDSISRSVNDKLRFNISVFVNVSSVCMLCIRAFCRLCRWFIFHNLFNKNRIRTPTYYCLFYVH